MRERRSRLRSIPRRTTLDVQREQAGKKVSPQSSANPSNTSGLTFRQARHGNSQEVSGFDTSRYVFKKPTREKPNKTLIIPEAEKITWETEVHENYGSLGLILQFSGIRFTNSSNFKKSKTDYGADSRVVYSRIEYKNRLAFLILATFGDIFESQVVAAKKDVNPFFREETYLPQLTKTHDPTSMTVYEKNRLVIVNYKRL